MIDDAIGVWYLWRQGKQWAAIAFEAWETKSLCTRRWSLSIAGEVCLECMVTVALV